MLRGRNASTKFARKIIKMAIPFTVCKNRNRSLAILTPSAPLLCVLLVFMASHIRAADGFEFVVIGDTRPRFQSENFAIFESLIARMNALKPAFVINVGDLIYGYGLRSKEKQWDKYAQVIKAIEVPYHQLPGNHDTFSKAARKAYGRRFGKFYQSFDYGPCHFVLLDNTEAQSWGYLGPAELAWLKADLHAAQGRPAFVFMHFPVWDPERVAPKYYQFWMQSLHPLFKQANVRAVFAGHYHSYGPSREFDGIRYFITGGGGAELRPVYKKAGGQFHFVKVKVSGNKLDVLVITEQGELTDAEADILGGLEFAAKYSTRVGLNQDLLAAGKEVSFSLSLHNPYQEPMGGSAAWDLDASAFQMQPEKIAIQIPPGGTQKYDFTLQVLKEKVLLQSLPRLEFNLVSGGWHRRFQRSVHFLQELEAGYRPLPLKLDGKLDDWGASLSLRMCEHARPEAELRAAHDGANLYLAATLPAGKKTDEAEESAFPDDLQIGIAARLNQTDFGHDLLRLGFTGTGAKIVVTDRTPGAKAAMRTSLVKCYSRNEGSRTTYEVAIPFALLESVKPKAGTRVVVNLAFPVPEEDSTGEEPAEPIHNTFAYQVRYGSDSLVPVHFIELNLEGRK
jgi:hypothetical protein